MFVLNISTTFIWNISHSKKKWTRYDQKCILIFMWSTGYYCEILIKVEFSRKILEKNYLNSKFQENPSFGIRGRNSFTQEDGRTVMTKRIICFSQLCERVWKRTKLVSQRGIYYGRFLGILAKLQYCKRKKVFESFGISFEGIQGEIKIWQKLLLFVGGYLNIFNNISLNSS